MQGHGGSKLMKKNASKKEFCYKENIVLRTINPIHFLMDISNNQMIELNDTAFEIYSSLGIVNSVSEIAIKLSKKYEDIPFEIILNDITVFLTNLCTLGYVFSKFDIADNTLKTTNKNVYDYYKIYWAENRQPYKAKFELTAKCNFDCFHCYQGKNKGDRNELTTLEVKQILDELALQGVLYLNLTGGEPFLRKDFKELYTHAKKKGFLIRIFTNGSYIDQGLLNLLTILPPEKIIVSIYGASDDTYEINTKVKGAFDKVIENIKKLIGAGLNVSLKTVLSYNIIDDFTKICEIASDLSVELRYAYYIYPSIDNNTKICNQMIDVAKMLEIDISNSYDSSFGLSISNKTNEWHVKYQNGDFVPVYRCTIGCNELSIDYKGNMRACTSYTKYGGNLLEESFLNIWDRFANIKNEEITGLNKCVKCDAIYYCNNCPSDQKAYYNNAEMVNETLCKFAKAKKMYYKDKFKYDKIIEILELNK